MKKKKKHYREIDLTLRVLRMVRDQAAVEELNKNRALITVYDRMNRGETVPIFKNERLVK